jgi:hypothetical protein
MIKSDARNFEHQFQDRDNPKQIRKKIIHEVHFPANSTSMDEIRKN